MHKAPLPALFLIAILVATSARAADPPRRSSESAIAEIKRLTTVEWPQASVRGDVQWFDRHFADELLIIDGQTGETATKAQTLGSLRPSPAASGREQVEDLRVNIYDDVAVASYKMVFSGNDNIHPWLRIVVHTEVWVFRDQRWQLVALHASVVPQEHGGPMTVDPDAD